MTKYDMLENRLGHAESIDHLGIGVDAFARDCALGFSIQVISSDDGLERAKFEFFGFLSHTHVLVHLNA